MSQSKDWMPRWGDEMADAGDTPVAATPIPAVAVSLTTGEVLRGIKDNFAVLSGIAFIVGIGLATLFLSTYLSVFDWHLLWFVQYTDILTFGLLAVGLIAGSLMLLQTMAQTLLNTFAFEARTRWRWWILLGLLVSAILASNIYGSIRRGEGYFHVFHGALVLGLGVVLITLLVRHFVSGKWPDVRRLIFAMIFLAITVAALGQWLGHSVLESAQFEQNVTYKGGTLDRAKLIIVMTRHTVFLKHKVLYIIPTADIAKFQTAEEQ